MSRSVITHRERHAGPVRLRRRTLLVGAFAGFAACAAPAPQALRIHGADNVFTHADVAIVWAVLKDESAGTADVWLRIVARGRAFSHAAIDGVDPFSHARQRIAAELVLAPERLWSSERSSFEALPSREIHFYPSAADLRAGHPALTVFYLGVPDTTPEFTSRAAMERYLAGVPLTSR